LRARCRDLRRTIGLGALGVFLVVFLSTFPVVIPFIFTREARLGLRISNGVAIAMLFLTGYAFGRYTGRLARGGRVLGWWFLAARSWELQ